MRFNKDGGNEPCVLGDGTIIRESVKAVLARIKDKEIWIPKSCIHDDSEAYSTAKDQNEGSIVVMQWWAEKNGHG